jgi:hypothetical protein
MSIKVASGRTAETMYRIYGATTTNGKIMPYRGKYRDAMLFYARVPTDATPTTYRQGIWAVGKCQIDSPLAISVPFDTSSLGEVNAVANFGAHYYFVHAGDGSISRLDTPSGTYDVPATLETLMYGADSQNLKELNGISILTENLPASASIEVSYRTDTDSVWTSLGTSSTTGTQTHNFTRVAGVPIGKFREIQFRITATGKIVLKSYKVSINELDDLPFA